MKSLIALASFSILVIFAAFGHCAEPYLVVFETLDCNGNTGFSTIAPERIHKIENGDCSNPENPDKKLKNMLVHDGQGSYLLYSMSEEEARKVMDDVRDYMQAKKGVLEKSNTVIITQ